MSTLQWALIGVGLALLAGVWAYHRWQARRWMPRRQRAAVASADTDGADGEAGTGDAQRQEPHLDVPAPAAARPAVAPALLSERLDVIVPLVLERPVTAEAVLQALPGTRRIGSKPFFVEGLPDDAADEVAWEALTPGRRYRQLRVGLQLANRAGPLNEIEFSEFAQRLQHWAEHLQAAVDCPDMMAVVQRARALDAFAAAHDAQLTFTLRARRAAWNPGYVMQHAARLGFVPGSLPGRMVLPASRPGGAPLLVLQFETQAALADDPALAVLREVRLTLDVTHVPQDEDPYPRLRALADRLADAMDGWVTDDTGQVLAADAFDRIGGELGVLYDALRERGFEAGSPDARRLFSG